MTENKKSWGGARQGSGRRRTSSRTIAIRVPEDVAAILDETSGSKTEYIIAAIRAYSASNKNDLI